jgi:hypothetical protein
VKNSQSKLHVVKYDWAVQKIALERRIREAPEFSREGGYALGRDWEFTVLMKPIREPAFSG